MDLLANGKIPDPYVDMNELAVQWVGEKTWIYKLQFTPPATTHKFTDIVFEGLDTFAKVTLNGKEILASDNMFVSYRVNINDAMIPDQENVLEIEFDSALLKGRQLVEEHKHEHEFYVRQSEAGRVAVRKAQYNWGWDWGPILMTAGPWKPVYLDQYTAKLDDIWVQHLVGDDLQSCSGFLLATVEGDAGADATVKFTLTLDNETILEAESKVDNNGTAQAPFGLSNPKLWYPFRYGSPVRYSFTASLHRSSAQLDTKTRLVGFRKTELVQEDDSHGKSFYFRINNIDVFAGGSCWIPADNMVSQISPQRYYDWVKLAVEGNQDMIRVWGGGIYEDDAFMAACDELGVLVWHDFQFACASYPTYKSYLDTFTLEATQQIQRFRWRPSVVVWAGNNEDYQVQERYKLDYDYANKDPDSWLKSSFPARYIYEYLLPELLKEHDPHNLYHPSSPWGDGKPWADLTVGDMHQWNIWHGTMEKYQDAAAMSGRFVSEFGMAAYPHVSTNKAAITDASQLYPGSMMLDFRNKAIGHERRTATYIAENFRFRDGFGEFTHLSQTVQSETMRWAYKTWRRQWNTPGQRKCGGVLVWQLNDCWPTASWAVVDYYLVKKPAYYAIARAMRTIDVGVTRTVFDWCQTTELVDEFSGLKTGQIDLSEAARKGTFDVWIASSAVEEIEVSLTVRFISIKTGKDVCAPIQRKTIAGANRTTEVIEKEALPASIPDADDYTVPFAVAKHDPYVVHATLTLPDGTVVSDSAWPDPIKYLDFAARNVQFAASEDGEHVTISAEKPVKAFVFEETPGMKLSDNGFDIMPGEDVTVRVQGSKVQDLLWTHIGAKQASMSI